MVQIPGALPNPASSNTANRCREAGIEDETDFATNPALARGMIERALTAGVPASWVTGDDAYGQDSSSAAGWSPDAPVMSSRCRATRPLLP